MKPSPMYEEIQAHLRSYLRGEKSLDEFEDWFVPATWHLGKGDDLAADKLTGKILLYFAEFSNGHLTEDEIQELLSDLVEQSASRPGKAVLTS